MTSAASAGWVVVLNGAPRSGKSSIAAVIQETFDGPWMNLGVDAAAAAIRDRLDGPPPAAFRRLATDA